MMKKTIAILLAVLLLAAMLSGCGAKSQASAETVSITVVYADESTEEFELSCEHSTLADALVAEGLISQEEADAGFVTSVNGVFADFDAEEAWWRVADAEGRDALKGIDAIDTADADGYSFIYTIGF